MTDFKRFAVYYAPDPGPLADFGAEWLGWDLATGRARAHPEIPGLDIAALTATPRKYGLHGTIKPPFHLAPGTDFAALSTAFGQLCAALSPITLPGLDLTRLGGFLALTVPGNTAPLNALAARVVRELDAFRARPSLAELARRRQSRLSPRQEDLLTQWGYPYVMEEFRFHITLTGKMPRPEAETIHQRILPLIHPLLPRPFTIGALCLVGEDASGLFHLIHRRPLSS